MKIGGLNYFTLRLVQLQTQIVRKGILGGGEVFQFVNDIKLQALTSTVINLQVP